MCVFLDDNKSWVFYSVVKVLFTLEWNSRNSIRNFIIRIDGYRFQSCSFRQFLLWKHLNPKSFSRKYCKEINNKKTSENNVIGFLGIRSNRLTNRQSFPYTMNWTGSRAYQILFSIFVPNITKLSFLVKIMHWNR